jgi:phenylalanyl-tRNA synthetase alpha chain
MKQRIIELEKQALAELESLKEEAQLEEFRVSYLGKKGALTSMLRAIAEVPAGQRPELGKLLNRVKENINLGFSEKRDLLIGLKSRRDAFLDITLPGRAQALGTLHPITKVAGEICGIFSRMGFKVVTGPEVELDYYNFEALNIPKDHPARDMQDTFYVSDSVVLRTHTSPMQVRVMESQPPPVSIIAPGKVYRRDSDVTHTPMFNQVEGLLVDRDVSFGDLKGTLTSFVHQMFGPDIELRFRPSFFPFTEPSAEVDIRCVMCKGRGCRTCSHTGWLEILGSGMVDPAVYGFVGYDPEVYSGFAFGMGVERIAMLTYGIEDIQMFYRNDIRFLGQF